MGITIPTDRGKRKQVLRDHKRDPSFLHKARQTAGRFIGRCLAERYQDAQHLLKSIRLKRTALATVLAGGALLGAGTLASSTIQSWSKTTMEAIYESIGARFGPSEFGLESKTQLDVEEFCIHQENEHRPGPHTFIYHTKLDDTFAVVAATKPDPIRPESSNNVFMVLLTQDPQSYFDPYDLRPTFKDTWKIYGPHPLHAFAESEKSDAKLRQDFPQIDKLNKLFGQKSPPQNSKPYLQDFKECQSKIDEIHKRTLQDYDRATLTIDPLSITGFNPKDYLRQYHFARMINIAASKGGLIIFYGMDDTFNYGDDLCISGRNDLPVHNSTLRPFLRDIRDRIRSRH